MRPSDWLFMGSVTLLGVGVLALVLVLFVTKGPRL